MFLEELKIGKPLEIMINREGFIYHFVSTIERSEEKRVCVTLIQGRTGSIFKSLPEDQIELVYHNEDRMWKWKTKDCSVMNLEGDHVHVFMTEKSQGVSYNRRAAFRVFLGEQVEITYKAMDLELVKKYRSEHPEVTDIRQLKIEEECYSVNKSKGIVKDFSENGIGLYCAVKLPDDAEISFEMQTEFGNIECTCVPIRQAIEDMGWFPYFYGCKIVTVSKNIIKILFDFQRQQIAKKKRREDLR